MRHISLIPWHRSVITHLRYRRHQRNKKPGCTFCAYAQLSFKFHYQDDYFYVIDNNYPYARWDGAKVAKHCLLIPKRHIKSISDFTEKEQRVFLQLAAKWEADGYSIYTRTPHNQGRSIAHQHSHFIKLA